MTLHDNDHSNRRAVLRSSSEWCSYFRTNATRLDPIPWEAGLSLADSERKAIGRSLQIFQLGESGTGRHILRAAERYAESSGDTDYPTALRLFFAEEHRHARDLGRVLDLLGLPGIERNWSDGVFRTARHIVGFECAIAILLTPELIARIYYAGIRRATNAPVLRRLCEQILKDETMHVRFQCERLALIRRRRPDLVRAMSLVVQSTLFVGACVVFWMSHRRAMRAGGFNWRRFWRRARHEWRKAVKQMDPARYHPPLEGEGMPTIDVRPTLASRKR